MVETQPFHDNYRPCGRWFVGHTSPRKEELAQFHLAQQGFETFLPRILSTRRHAHRVEIIKAALFPRYLFIRLDLTQDRWRSINGTIGMSHLVTAGELPCAVPAGFVEGLKLSVCRDGVINLVPEVAPGDAVRIIAGPFAGHIGELLRLDANGRVEILLELLNGAARLKLARELLGPVE